jgi:hypothetical protein
MLLLSVTFVSFLKLAFSLKRKQEDFCAVENAGNKETFDSVLNLKYFIKAVPLAA